jgi:hypothetical protein
VGCGGPSDPQLQRRKVFSHLLHEKLTRVEVEGVHFNSMPYDEAVLRYAPAALKPGWNALPDGEEIYYISNPALGLWADWNRY